MLNDKAMVKIVKQGNKKGKRLFIYNVDKNYYFSDTYGIYKFYPEFHEKTAQELAKIFMGLPGEGESFGIANKEKMDTVPNIMNMFFDAEKEKYEHELKATNYMKEVKNWDGELKSIARILINNEFVTLMNNEYFNVTKEHHTLKNNSRNSLIAVFNEDELLAIIIPIKSEKPEKIDKFIEIAA